ncbi:MAG TPA: thioredoxin family protein [Methylomirabilota bacterium]|jgi:thiol-disulfide isomerase/thioredoxin
MIKVLRVSCLVLLALALLPAVGGAAQVTTYTKQAFLDAQQAGKPIIVFVTASWCPNCRKQQPIVDELSREKAFADALVFVIDYDASKDALRDLNVQMQSTLIAFNGRTERMRSTAVTDPVAVRALFQSAL